MYNTFIIHKGGYGGFDQDLKNHEKLVNTYLKGPESAMLVKETTKTFEKPLTLSRTYKIPAKPPLNYSDNGYGNSSHAIRSFYSSGGGPARRIPERRFSFSHHIWSGGPIIEHNTWLGSVRAVILLHARPEPGIDRWGCKFTTGWAGDASLSLPVHFAFANFPRPRHLALELLRYPAAVQGTLGDDENYYYRTLLSCAEYGVRSINLRITNLTWVCDIGRALNYGNALEEMRKAL
ncbi:hypothetical protein CIB48_g5228 [Xylaria polymorpha]|nr:hypothetical protein CIB48_g5228 [Xylaria polymorpha]